MNKKTLIAVGVIVAVIVGALLYVALKPSDSAVAPSPSATETENKQTTTENEEGSEQNQKARTGVYVDYSEQAVASAEGTKILFFHAPWCPQCREIESTINENGVPAGATVLKVDYDTNQALRQKYGITIQTSFVKIDDQGNGVETYVAYEDPDFRNVEKALLP